MYTVIPQYLHQRGKAHVRETLTTYSRPLPASDNGSLKAISAGATLVVRYNTSIITFQSPLIQRESNMAYTFDVAKTRTPGAREDIRNSALEESGAVRSSQMQVEMLRKQWCRRGQQI